LTREEKRKNKIDLDKRRPKPGGFFKTGYTGHLEYNRLLPVRTLSGKSA
jgi:hypothetical protein